MIRFFVICLFVSIGYVPSSFAYAAIGAPPVEKSIKKVKTKRKKVNRKFRKIRKEQKIKPTTGLLIVALVLLLPGVIISALASTLPLSILILGLVFLLLALTLCIAALIIHGTEKQKEKDNANGMDMSREKKEHNGTDISK